jgi:hypothetical protein
MSETTHDQNESGKDWHPPTEGDKDTIDRAEDALLAAADELGRQRSAAEIVLDNAMDDEGVSPEDLLTAKENVRSLVEVSRLLAEFMPEDGQTVDQWYAKRTKEITDEFDERCDKLEDGTVYHFYTHDEAVRSRASAAQDLLRARMLLTSHFK